MWPFSRKSKPEAVKQPQSELISIDEMKAWNSNGIEPWAIKHFNGDKFYNGYGLTDIQVIDYWALRRKSASMFTTNLYARGIIRRFTTNVINEGLSLESTIENSILGMSDDDAADWTENTENRFNLWSSNPELCDYSESISGQLGQIQDTAYLEALVEGDVLVVIRHSRKYGLPSIQLISGSSVQDPPFKEDGVTITHGVELDSRKRQVAYHVLQEDGTTKRIAAKGSRTGRRKAFLLYATDKRMDEVRGQPLLSLVLQSIKEIDRYRDSVQRKALINSFLAMFIKKDQAVLGTAPMTGAATRVDTAKVSGDQAAIDGGTGTREVPLSQHIPGMVMQELAPGETPVAFDGTSSDLNFGGFEGAIMNGVAWGLEMPPEILQLAFSSNYSASQAAINEFKMFLNKIRRFIGRGLLKPIFIEWFISEVILGKIQAPGYLEALRDPSQYDIETAWTLSDWTGAIKPSTDVKKQAQGHEIMVDRMWVTNARAAREISGTKFSKNVKIVKRENELKAAAMRPILELEQEFGTTNTMNALARINDIDSRVDDLEEGIQDG